MRSFFSKLWNRWKRHAPLVFADAILVLIAVYAAMLMRFAPILPEGMILYTTKLLPFLMLSYLGSFALFRMYDVLWRYADARQQVYLALANIVSCGVTFAWNQLFSCGMSLYYLLILCAVSIAGTCGVRLGLRAINDLYTGRRVKDEFQLDKPRLLVVGAGRAGSYVVSLFSEGADDMGQPVAIVDDDRRKHGMNIRGVPVVGGIADIPDVVREKSINAIVIAMPSVRGERLREIVSVCKRTRAYVRIMSDPLKADAEFQQGRFSAREPNLSDFISRTIVDTDEEQLRAFAEGKTVLVTGGAGSVGSEIVKKLLCYAPREVVAFDICESALLELKIEANRLYGSGCPLRVAVGSVCDRERLSDVFRRHRPNAVFHAASYGCVSLLESNPGEAAKTNVFGARNVRDAAAEAGCETFVLISSEKAADPASVAGATRRAGEIAVLAGADEAPMQIAVVRLGTILGGVGSVVPRFAAQIQSGGPVTITHSEIERRLLSAADASVMAIQAAAFAENGCVYVPDGIASVKIRELAEKLIRFYGFEPDADISIEVTGLRTGEKLTETAVARGEAPYVAPTSSANILRVRAPLPGADKTQSALNGLREAIRISDDGEVLLLLRELVPEYCPVSE